MTKTGLKAPVLKSAKAQGRSIELKSGKEIESLRVSGRLAAELLEALCQSVQPGMTTLDLDAIAVKWIKEHDSQPAFLGYRDFPKTICVSVNEEVVHGIPGSKRLREGDIVGIDVGLIHNGWYGDTARTVPVGKITAEAQKLLEVSNRSLWESIQAAKAGNRLGDVSHAMQSIAEKGGYSVVRDYGGHGIGRKLHEDPHVPCLGTPGTGMRLKAGMVLALEVMVNAGDEQILHKPDHWTVVTKDGSWSAHFEHMVAITDGGTEVLTKL